MLPLALAGAAVLILTASCWAEPVPEAGAVAGSSPLQSDQLQGAGAATVDARPILGLMGTIPIYWGEADALGDLLSSVDPHWARGVLEQRYDLRPLDTVEAASLSGLNYLLLAQPRALSPQENVDLDAWVRAGGQVLLFADPLMTGESHFGLGDRRRPQDVILLSPLLSHWGLSLTFDDDQPNGFRLVQAANVTIPVQLFGQLSTEGPKNNDPDILQSPSEVARRGRNGGASKSPIGENAGQGCVLEAEAILATCRIGRGKALVLADAAVLDLHHPHSSAPEALKGLMGKFSTH